MRSRCRRSVAQLALYTELPCPVAWPASFGEQGAQHERPGCPLARYILVWKTPLGCPYAAALLRAQCLNVASASGEPALTIARVLPEARVMATDFADPYVALGEARAAREGLGQRVSFQTADAEDLSQFGDGSMDVVTCSFGACGVEARSQL
jgi:hypothetical protein